MDTNSLNWAIGENSDKAEDPRLQDSSVRKIIWFNIRDFLAQVEKPWVIDPDDLTYRQIDKVAKCKAHFERGDPMDPSDVQGLVCDIKSRGTPDDKRIVLEGRNRLVAALQLGETQAPFAVPLDIIDYLHTEISNLNWAIGEHSDKAEEPRLLDLSIRKIVWLDIKKLNAWIRLKSGFTLNHVHQAKLHWKYGGWMDPSEIKGFSKTGVLLVEGKNRLAAALELGETHAPFSVSIDIADDFLEKYHSIV